MPKCTMQALLQLLLSLSPKEASLEYMPHHETSCIYNYPPYYSIHNSLVFPHKHGIYMYMYVYAHVGFSSMDICHQALTLEPYSNLKPSYTRYWARLLTNWVINPQHTCAARVTILGPCVGLYIRYYRLRDSSWTILTTKAQQGLEKWCGGFC